MYKVIRKIEFSYGHRLVGHKGKCARLHGHNGLVEVEVAAERLNDMNMVIDFSDISETIGRWIDDQLDHKMILWKEDPLTETLKEKGEEFLIVDENPTAEFLAKYIFDQAKLLNLPIKRVTVHETCDGSASYEV